MIRVDDISLSAGTFRLEEIAFEVGEEEHVALMGRSGSGKTTILDALAGLRPVERGRVLIAGADATRLAPADRGIGYVPQDVALFSHLDVRGNLEFPLRIRRWSNTDIHTRTREVARMLGIEALLGRKPAGLSGGEAQRVALGRAIAFRPRVVMLDEPMSALDDAARGEMRAVLRAMRAAAPVAILHVTHHAGDADHLADRILRLEDGKIA